MPIARFEMPDGRIARFEVPEGTTPEQAQAMIAEALPAAQGERAAQPLSRTDKVLQGIKDPISGGAQMLTKALPAGLVEAGNRLNNWLADKTGMVGRLPEGGVDQQVREEEAQYQARRAAGGESGFDGYRTIGNVISPVNIGIAATMPAAAATLPARMAAGAAGGAVSAAFNPVTEGDFSEEKKRQMAIGGAFGGATPALMAGLGRVVSPAASRDPNLAMLKAEGVRPTVGQSVGGWANALEEKAQSLPVIGDSIRAARSRSLDDFNRAAINRATSKIGQQVDGSGTDAIKQAGDLISDAYDAAKNQLGGFKIDPQAKKELGNLQMLAMRGLEGRERSTVKQYFQNYINTRDGLTAETFKELDSKLTNDIAKFSSGDAYQQKVGDALKEVQRILTDNAKRANPDAAKALKAADAAYANLVRLEGAAVGAKGNAGVFTPGQLLTAVRGADKSARDRATARGTALMQDLATAGNAVLGNKVPNSGTADRLWLGGAALGGAGYVSPYAVGGLLGGAALYSNPAQTLLRGAVSSRPEFAQPVANALQQASPGLIPLGAQVGLGLLN